MGIFKKSFARQRSRGTTEGGAACHVVMNDKPVPANSPMTAAQAALLKQLAHDAFDLEAFSAQLTQNEAERRIATLQAMLKLQGEPPHVA